MSPLSIFLYVGPFVSIPFRLLQRSDSQLNAERRRRSRRKNRNRTRTFKSKDVDEQKNRKFLVLFVGRWSSSFRTVIDSQLIFFILNNRRNRPVGRFGFVHPSMFFFPLSLANVRKEAIRFGGHTNKKKHFTQPYKHMKKHMKAIKRAVSRRGPNEL